MYRVSIERSPQLGRQLKAHGRATGSFGCVSTHVHQGFVRRRDSTPCQVEQSDPAPVGAVASLSHPLVLSRCPQLACCLLMDLAVGPAPQNFQRDGAMSSELQSFHVFVLCLASWLADLQHRKHVMGHHQITKCLAVLL